MDVNRVGKRRHRRSSYCEQPKPSRFRRCLLVAESAGKDTIATRQCEANAVDAEHVVIVVDGRAGAARVAVGKRVRAAADDGHLHRHAGVVPVRVVQRLQREERSAFGASRVAGAAAANGGVRLEADGVQVYLSTTHEERTAEAGATTAAKSARRSVAAAQ